MQMQPYLFFDGRCEEAIEFYRKALGAEVEHADALQGQSRARPEGVDPARQREQGDARLAADRRHDGDGLRRPLHRQAEVPGILR